MVLTEEIKSLTPIQKAELYKLLQDDEELKIYLAYNQKLYDELAQRDAAYEDGEIKLTSRLQLSTRLKNRRDAL